MSRIFNASGAANNHLVSPTGFYSTPNAYVSMFCWVKRVNSTINALMLYRDATTATAQYTEMRQSSDGGARVGTRSSGGVHTAITASNGVTDLDTWLPVAITSAEGDLNVYIPEASNFNGDNNEHVSTTNMRLYLGVNTSFSSTNSLTGKLAHCAMWDRPLTEEEIAALISGAAVPGDFPTGLIDYWPMTDGSTGDEVGVNGTVLTMVGTIGTDADDNPLTEQTAPTISNVNNTNTITSNGEIYINGDFPVPISTVDYGGYALNIDRQTTGQVTCVPFDVHDSPLGYTAHTLTVTNASAESDNIQVTLHPGEGTVVVTGANVDTTYGLAQAGGADGDTWETPEGSGNSAIALLPDTNMVFTPAVPNGFTSPFWLYSGGAWAEDSYQVNGGGNEVIPPTYSNQTSGTYEQVSVNLATGWVNANPDGFGVSRLPSGLSMSPQGLVTGRPLSLQTVTGIIVTNSGVNSNAFDWTVILGDAIPPSYTTRRVYTGLPYFTNLSNGWLNTDGSAFTVDALPDGLTMDTAGLVTGTPTTVQEVNSVVSHRGISANPFAWIVTEAPPTGSLVDAKWNALRGQGFTGAMSDMTLQWLQANGATSGHISDAWMEMLSSKLPESAAIEYQNPMLLGGAPSGPVDGDNPPNDHAIGNNELKSGPVSGGWEINPDGELGRSFLLYRFGNKNPDIPVGTKLRLYVDVESGTSGVATETVVFAGGVVGVEHSADSVVEPGTRRICTLDLEITAPGYSGNVRMGTGVGEAGEEHITIHAPIRLEVLGPVAYAGQRNDLWYRLLGDMGYTGSLPDRELAFWLDGGVLPGVVAAGPEELATFLESEGWAVELSGTVFTVTEGVHEWAFTWQEAEDGVYADDIPAPLRNDIDDFFGR